MGRTFNDCTLGRIVREPPENIQNNELGPIKDYTNMQNWGEIIMLYISHKTMLTLLWLSLLTWLNFNPSMVK